MRAYCPDRVTSPPLDQGWESNTVGVTPKLSRVVGYGSVLILLLANIAPIAIFGPEYWEQISRGLHALTPIGVALACLAYFSLYAVLHESVHASQFPGGFRSPRSFWGIYGASVAVFYNGPISIARYRRVILAPLVLFGAPLVALLLAAPSHLTWILLVAHLLMCTGDLALLYVLRKLPGDTEIWCTGSDSWMRHPVPRAAS